MHKAFAWRYLKNFILQRRQHIEKGRLKIIFAQLSLFNDDSILFKSYSDDTELYKLKICWTLHRLPTWQRKHAIFTLLFCIGQHGIVLKCVPHVLHASVFAYSTKQILNLWYCPCRWRRRGKSSVTGIRRELFVTEMYDVHDTIRQKFPLNLLSLTF